MRTIWTLAFLMCICTLQAAKLDTVMTYSKAMKKNVKAVVVTPDNYNLSKPWPVVYLLHGFGGRADEGWVSSKEMIDLADIYQVIMVSADGHKDSWYFDSPIDPSYKYETYVATELPQWIDQHYSTIKTPKGRAITGLSMGGHGALYLAFKHQDIFGAAGSMSGGVDFRPFPNNWSIPDRLGKYAEYPDVWNKHTVINMLHLLTPGSLALIVDCGTDDFFYNVNCNFHQKLLANKIPHTFISRPGAHNWEYWRIASKTQFLFFSQFFAQQ